MMSALKRHSTGQGANEVSSDANDVIVFVKGGFSGSHQVEALGPVKLVACYTSSNMSIVVAKLTGPTSSLFIFTESGIDIRTGGKIVEMLDKSSDSMMRHFASVKLGFRSFMQQKLVI